MKKLLILLFSFSMLTAFAQQKKVAVYVTGQQSGVSKVLGDQLVAAFAKSGKYTAVERTSSFLAELSKEQGYQRSGAVNDRDIARLGIQFGVNYVCVADISDVFGEKYITARLINVETSEIVNTHNVSGEMSNMSSCLQMAREIAENLSKGTFAEQAAAEELVTQGWVDLGLPSGTLWRNKNEVGYYAYDDAVRKFSESLPSIEQWKELIDLCQWTWLGDGYRIQGDNGNNIILQIKGCYNGDKFFGSLGAYWSSTPCPDRSRRVEDEFYNRAYEITFHSTAIDWGSSWAGARQSIRLVRQRKQ